MLEANLALLLFLAAYKLLLTRETNFRFMRFFMLAAIFISLSFPLMRFNNIEYAALPSVGNVVPSYWLPEIVIGTNAEQQVAESTNAAYDIWQVAGWIYAVGTFLFLCWLAVQLANVLRTIRQASFYQLDKFKIIESAEDKPTFSFFHLIYIGRAHELSDAEKQQIIRHEAVHASQWHSLDILIITIIRIIFWFNPFINLYKKIFVQLHEFEADARAVENSDVNKYCSLLAKVALQSAHFPIASHFNQSLTLKRIEMMRTIKTKIRPWKVAVLAAIIPLSFFIVACQDQVVDELANSTIVQNSDYPPEVKTHMDAYMKDHPDAKLTYVEGFKEEIEKLTSSPGLAQKIVYTYALKKDGGNKAGLLLSNIVQHAEALQTDDKVFMVVEQQPEFPGGFDALKMFIQQNMKYPEAAAKAGIAGTVYVSMVVNTDGALSDVKIQRGVEASIDAEAVRVIQALPPWKPGQQNGKAVRVRYILPVKFDPNNNSDPVPPSEISQVNDKLDVTTHTTTVDGNTIVVGNVKSVNDNEALAGVNVIVMGTTTGTTTDIHGDFKIKIPKEKKDLVFSFIGFESKKISF